MLESVIIQHSKISFFFTFFLLNKLQVAQIWRVYYSKRCTNVSNEVWVYRKLCSNGTDKILRVFLGKNEYSRA